MKAGERIISEGDMQAGPGMDSFITCGERKFMAHHFREMSRFKSGSFLLFKHELPLAFSILSKDSSTL